MYQTYQFISTPIEYPNTPDAYIEITYDGLKVYVDEEVKQVAYSITSMLYFADYLRDYITEEDYRDLRKNIDKF